MLAWGDCVLFAERTNELIFAACISDCCHRCEVKASCNRRLSQGLDPKPGELRMSRVNPE